jgi:hypothetical protein
LTLEEYKGAGGSTQCWSELKEHFTQIRLESARRKANEVSKIQDEIKETRLDVDNDFIN